jgi:hypothetical protein
MSSLPEVPECISNLLQYARECTWLDAAERAEIEHISQLMTEEEAAELYANLALETGLRIRIAGGCDAEGR